VVSDGISIDGEVLAVLSERSPRDLPWSDMGVDVVIESTGIFNSREQSAQHLEAGAPFVVVSAPCSNADATFVVGVNDATFDPATHKVVSNASCTTNCFVPLVKVLDDAFGVRKGLMTTVHAYTGDQSIVDGPHSDLRRARAAAINIIPTSTGAARATALVLQSMQGKLDGIALRVPVPTGSLTDFTAVLDSEPSIEEINSAFAAAAATGPLAGVMDYTEAPIVSSDVVTSPASCTYDAGMTLTLGSMVKVAGWYDNEWGYSNRLVDLALIVGAAN
ncbi:type I glyceraldehyde-3-phosphate dehydrogenase, partial [Acidimicrobiaceae bacterium AH-315-P05]|nr:type I glyceraldehyde-3-phosphate dehydrogenase [Acidimicrobiaceae bacterium AH-315-P05]